MELVFSPFFLLVWLACGLFAAFIAKSKGRSFIGWLVLGVFFGIIALLAAGFLPKVKNHSMPYRATKALRCPHCGGIIGQFMDICPNCGHRTGY